MREDHLQPPLQKVERKSLLQEMLSGQARREIAQSFLQDW